MLPSTVDIDRNPAVLLHIPGSPGQTFPSDRVVLPLRRKDMLGSPRTCWGRPCCDFSGSCCARVSAFQAAFHHQNTTFTCVQPAVGRSRAFQRKERRHQEWTEAGEQPREGCRASWTFLLGGKRNTTLPQDGLGVEPAHIERTHGRKCGLLIQRVERTRHEEGLWQLLRFGPAKDPRAHGQCSGNPRSRSGSSNQGTSNLRLFGCR